MDRASAASGQSRPHLPPAADRRRRGERGTRARGIRCSGATKRRPLPRPRTLRGAVSRRRFQAPSCRPASHGPSPARPAARPVHAPPSHAAFPAPPSRDVAFGTKEPAPDRGRARPLPKPDGLPAGRRIRPAASAPRMETSKPAVAKRRARLRSFRAEARRAAGDGQPIRWPPPCSASPCRIRS